MKNEIELLRNAQNEYLLKNEYNLTKNILAYIAERIKANRGEIEALIENNKEDIKYNDIEKLIEEEIKENIKFKDYKNLYISNDNFLLAKILMPIGIIAIEAYNTCDVVKYLIRGIKSRNAIVISDVEYSETSVRYLIYEIIKECLRKFNINENIIMILPYEECFYQYCDKVIYTYDVYGNKLDKYIEETKTDNEIKYIYIDTESMEETATKDNEKIEYEILKGNIDEVIEKINEKKCSAAVIYTDNAQNAYKYINLVKGKNVFVNASLQNVMKYEKSEEELYVYKNIILPIPKEMKFESEEIVKEDSNEEKSLIEINGNIFSKIKRYLLKLFRK